MTYPAMINFLNSADTMENSLSEKIKCGCHRASRKQMALCNSPPSSGWIISPQADMKPCIGLMSQLRVEMSGLWNCVIVIHSFQLTFIWNDMGFHLEPVAPICDLQSGSSLNKCMLLIVSELQIPLALYVKWSSLWSPGQQVKMPPS